MKPLIILLLTAVLASPVILGLFRMNPLWILAATIVSLTILLAFLALETRIFKSNPRHAQSTRRTRKTAPA